MSIEDKLKALVVDHLKIDASAYHIELGAGDIPEWDSLAHINLIMRVEKDFGITFDIAEAVDLETVEDFLEALRANNAA